ncbi:hypothetical protein MVES1_002463 [Malassezia vespertilionis]|uniref:RRM domain-containing protein n=1 Tax=Malassezia vespertilionis TaxID=2020962 RepID=A0A2N1JAT5_9BASI|nr:uncharacterized protein MVES1_002463 [Malassezia vespertilionis]PKI83666.1 hypothetical protein MVES_002326 [Malassezia vespertilionis]WFD07106.1 hypothetical protein MVES1_002463 [Malassezia vespertilionis]
MSAAQHDANGDPYAPFYYWDALKANWEFDYEAYYKTYGYPSAAQGTSSKPVTNSNDLAQQEQQAAIYDYDPHRSARLMQENKVGTLKPGESRKTVLRRAAGKLWEDQTLLQWDPNHKRLFVGDLGNDVTDDMLTKAFEKYTTFSKARVVRQRGDGKSKGYGFVAFADPEDFLRAWKEMDGKYIGSRPCRLKKANEHVAPVSIGARKDKILAANAKYDHYLAKGKTGGTVGRTLRRNGGIGKPYGKK